MSNGVLMWPAAMSGAERPLHQVVVDREILHPEDRIAVGLQVDLDLVADAGIHVVRPRDHHQARPVLARAPLQHLARLLAEPSAEVAQGAEAGVDRPPRLLVGEPGEDVLRGLEQLLGHELGLVERDEGRDVPDAGLGEGVLLLDEAGLDVLGRGHHARARERLGHVAGEERRQVVDHGGEQDVELLLLAEHQLAVVAGDALHGIAAVHRPAALAELPALLLGGVAREDDVARVDAELGEEPHPELMGVPEVQDAGDADPELTPRRRRRRPGGTRPCEPSRQR